MGKLRQWTLLTALGCLAVLAAGWMLVVTPQQKHAADARAERAAAEQSVNALQTKYSILLTQKAHVIDQQNKLLTFAQLMPDNPALPSLIRSLSTAADTAGVDLTSLSPQPPTLLAPVAAPAPAATSDSGAATSAKPPTSLVPSGPQVAGIPLAVTVTGGYFEVERFLDALEGLKRAFLVTGLNITPGASGAAAAPASAPFAVPGSGAATGTSAKLPGTLTVQLTGKVFMLASTAAPTLTTLPGVTPAK